SIEAFRGCVQLALAIFGLKITEYVLYSDSGEPLQTGRGSAGNSFMDGKGGLSHEKYQKVHC
ncbi:MAG: hypothetical protein LUE31_11140, partial [Lachnospiraceae bacterium]|nr:hypothetical protein [Lachnospiraceae bacterium]